VSVHASLTIEMPSSSFCELDGIDKCKEDDCVRYDPYVQKNSPSIFTIHAQGRVNDSNTHLSSQNKIKYFNINLFERSTTII
jgi:hypothetical protein